MCNEDGENKTDKTGSKLKNEVIEDSKNELIKGEKDETRLSKKASDFLISAFIDAIKNNPEKAKELAKMSYEKVCNYIKKFFK